MSAIVPAILEKTYEGFLAVQNQEVKLPGVQRIHVDFGDGEFVETKTVPVTEISTLTPAIHWEAHLMVKEPRDFLDYKICGFHTVIVHFEAFEHIKDLHEAINAIRSQGMEPAVCVNPSTSIQVLKGFEGLVKHFQIMSVWPGAQGQAFLPEALERIKELRHLIPNAIIELDGGMNIGNIRDIAAAGTDLIIAGSALTKAPNMPEAYEKLVVELNRPT